MPVLAPEPAKRGGLIRSVAPATQAMVLAASGFVAGAAVVGLQLRQAWRSRAGGLPGAGRAQCRQAEGETVKIVGTRSLLVDVHLLGGAEGWTERGLERAERARSCEMREQVRPAGPFGCRGVGVDGVTRRRGV